MIRIKQTLYEVVVKEQADGIIADLNSAINTLKETWKGVDAGVQINNVVDVYNGMAAVRNALAGLAKDSSVVAANYRDIQRLNSASIDELEPISVEKQFHQWNHIQIIEIQSILHLKL